MSLLLSPRGPCVDIESSRRSTTAAALWVSWWSVHTEAPSHNPERTPEVCKKPPKDTDRLTNKIPWSVETTCVQYMWTFKPLTRMTTWIMVHRLYHMWRPEWRVGAASVRHVFSVEHPDKPTQTQKSLSSLWVKPTTFTPPCRDENTIDRIRMETQAKHGSKHWRVVVY